MSGDAVGAARAAGRYELSPGTWGAGRWPFWLELDLHRCCWLTSRCWLAGWPLLKNVFSGPLPGFHYTSFLLLSRVSHVDGFFSRAEALWFDLVSFVCFRFSCQIQKIITKIYVEGIATYVFVWKFYGFGPSVQV